MALLSQIGTSVPFRITEQRWEDLRAVAKRLVLDYSVPIRVTTDAGDRSLESACNAGVIYVLRQQSIRKMTGVLQRRPGPRDDWPVIVVGREASLSHHFSDRELVRALMRHPAPPLSWSYDKRAAYADVSGVPLWLYPFVGNDQTFDMLRLVQHYMTRNTYAVIDGVTVDGARLQVHTMMACISRHHMLIDYNHELRTKRLAELKDLEKHSTGGTE